MTNSNKDLFADPITGKPYSNALILEAGFNMERAVYTIKEYEYEFKGKTFPSLKQLYLKELDLTEVKFARKYFLNYEQWRVISETVPMVHIMPKWREELARCIQQIGLDTIIEKAQEGSSQDARWLASRSWGTTVKSGVKAPVKKVDISDDLKDDLERMNKVVSIGD